MELPKKWNDLNSEQILKIQYWMNAGVLEWKVMEKTLAILMKIQQDTHIIIDFEDLKKATAPFLKRMGLTKTPIKCIPNGSFRRLYGPEDGYENMNFGEWMSLDSKMQKILSKALSEHTNDYESLVNEFMAMIFRPRKKGNHTGDIRMEFNADTVSGRIKAVKKLSFQAKSAMLFQFSSIKEVMAKSYPKVFKKDPEEKQKKSKKSSPGWLQVVHTYTKGDVTRYQQIFDTNVWLFFHSLNENNADAEKTIRDLEKLKNKR